MFFMLWQHAQSEMRSDQYHRDADRIVRVGVIWNWTDDGKNWDQARYAGTAARKTEELKNDFGDFDEALEVYNQGNFESPYSGMVMTYTLRALAIKVKDVSLSKPKSPMLTVTSFTSLPFH